MKNLRIKQKFAVELCYFHLDIFRILKGYLYKISSLKVILVRENLENRATRHAAKYLSSPYLKDKPSDSVLLRANPVTSSTEREYRKLFLLFESPFKIKKRLVSIHISQRVQLQTKEEGFICIMKSKRSRKFCNC